MIRINPFLPTNATDRTSSTKKKKDVAGGGLFGELLGGAEAASTSSGVAEAAPAMPLNPMLSLQEVSDEEVNIRQSVKRGQLTLDALDHLRDALLMGSLPSHLLGQMEKLVREQRTQTSDPRLNAILDDIELRAAVEVAKLEMAYLRKGI